MLHRLVPTLKRIALGVVAVLVVVSMGEASVKKPIIIFARAFEPTGVMNRTGNVIKLQGKGDAPEIWEVGDRLNIQVTVVQPQSGARAVGAHHPADRPAGSAPIRAEVQDGRPAFGKPKVGGVDIAGVGGGLQHPGTQRHQPAYYKGHAQRGDQHRDRQYH